MQSFPIGARRTRARRIFPSKGRTSFPPGDDKVMVLCFYFFFTLFTYVLWYCIFVRTRCITFCPLFIHALSRLLFPFLPSLTSFRLPFISSSFYLGKFVLAVDIVHRLLTFLRLRTYCKRKGQQRHLVYILF